MLLIFVEIEIHICVIYLRVWIQNQNKVENETFAAPLRLINKNIFWCVLLPTDLDFNRALLRIYTHSCIRIQLLLVDNIFFWHQISFMSQQVQLWAHVHTSRKLFLCRFISLFQMPKIRRRWRKFEKNWRRICWRSLCVALIFTFFPSLPSNFLYVYLLFIPSMLYEFDLNIIPTYIGYIDLFFIRFLN